MITARFRSQLRCAAALLAACAAWPALAATSTTTFAVTSTITATCTVAASTLAFGTYNPIGGANLDVNTTVTATCTNTTTYTVGLNAGTGAGATVASRKMTSATTTDLMNYSLYQDAGRTTVWGTTVGTDTVAGTGNGSGQALTVYGRVFSGQTTLRPASDYTDTITATITF